MPNYLYNILDEEGKTVGQCEIIQRISEDALTVHPETGAQIRRAIQAPFIGGSWSDHSMKKSVSDDKKLEQLGFTKYVKAGDGVYEKRAGNGPDYFSRDRPITAQDLKNKKKN